jgi:hypothetical protein
MVDLSIAMLNYQRVIETSNLLGLYKTCISLHVSEKLARHPMGVPQEKTRVKYEHQHIYESNGDSTHEDSERF